MIEKYHYHVLDAMLTSDVRLPELTPAVSSQDAEQARARITLSVGEVPERLADATTRTAIHQTRGNKDHIIDLPGLGRMLISNGKEITVAPIGDDTANSSAPNWRTIVLGSGLTSIAYQQGMVPLHANTVILPGEDGATLLMGHATAGKSTLSAALTVHGARLLADDLTAIRYRDGVFCALPGTKRIKLHDDSLRALGRDPKDCDPVRPRLKKYYFTPKAVQDEPVPVERCIILRHARSGQPEGVERLSGIPAFSSLSNHMHRRRAGAAMGLRGALFRQLTNMAATVPVINFCFSQDLGGLDQLAKQLITEI